MDTQKTQYKIASALTQKGLIKEAEKLMSEGWEPIGGVSNNAYYIQAFVK